MKKKYNNESAYFADWTTKKLKNEALVYDDLIFNIECFGVRDMITYSGICKELEKRKVVINTKLSFD
jgi:hypothetical protein